MRQQVKRKWRPPLGLVIGGTLLGVLALPMIAVGYFKLAGNILGWYETAQLFGFVAVVATAILGFLLWRLVLRPVKALTVHARAMKAGRIRTQLPSHFGTHEFSKLGQSVIDMGETLNNRADGLRAYAGHVTHELKSPLTAITGAAEMLGDQGIGSDQQDLARIIREAAARMERLLEELQRHAAASQQGVEGQADLADVALEVAGLEVVVTRNGPVPMPREDLRAVLEQLVQNAKAHGAARVFLHWEDACLRVLDDGAGVPEGDQGRIFDPFFTTRRETGGTGMGLSIVRALVQSHGGQIRFVPGDAGACFEISY
jgi:signal transduction histidine kinase